MTETEWSTSTHLERLLSAPNVEVTVRRSALLAVAWFRVVAEYVPLAELNWAAGVLEKRADGVASAGEITEADDVLNFAFNVPTGTADFITPYYRHPNAYPSACTLYYPWATISEDDQPPSTRGRLWLYFEPSWSGFASLRMPRKRLVPTLASLLRCIVGNPFRPVEFAPAWRTDTALALAAGIYAEPAFDRLPILADALEEAGCDNADVLAHCRGPGPHARGCWVVDGVLGKV